MRKSNYFLMNNGNVVTANPIMKNIEPRVEESKESKKRNTSKEVEGVNSPKKSPVGKKK
jgi:hypothetical protein